MSENIWGGISMDNKLRIGDTIKCKNRRDLLKTSVELNNAGVIVTEQSGYVLLVENIIDKEETI